MVVLGRVGGLEPEDFSLDHYNELIQEYRSGP
jgi:hypothetical protein